MTTRRLGVAGLAAFAGLLMFSPAVLAASHAASNAGHSTAAGQPASATGSTTDRDVPGAAVDPSKKDHDNGVGNNCDPGFGGGNQAKYGLGDQSTDPRDTGCPSTSGGVQGQSESRSSSANGNVAGETTGTGGTGAQGAAGGISPTTGSATGTFGALGTVSSGGVLASTATLASTVASATGAVLADTGTPLGIPLLGLLLLGLGLILKPLRSRA